MDGVLSERRAHPRACGENRICIRSAAPWKGSSPRMRGKRRTRLVRLPPPRLIPAHAGKTTYRNGQTSGVRAHPRACGENESAFAFIVYARGSSPRMRGKPRENAELLRRAGLIPAHAGKTRECLAGLFDRGAHPRACGENSEDSKKATNFEGSSPRMRGKPQVKLATKRAQRLIPAHAGKTTREDVHYTVNGAHPRACGENAPGVTPSLL